VKEYISGLKAGWPIGTGYFAVSAAFGMTAVLQGYTVSEAVMISLTNLTSAGQFAALPLLRFSASLIELILTQIVINSRYFLMSLSLTQKIEPSMPLWKRLVMSYCVTDEVYAVAVSSKGYVRFRWFLGLMTLPVLGWTLGTWFGAWSKDFLPEILVNALGLAMYAMFIAIVIPPAKKSRPVLYCVILACLISCLFAFVPGLNQISSGYSVIICTVAAAAFCAWKFPKEEEDNSAEESSAAGKSGEVK
jgi:predicted branched-subunit amino acid permease